MKKIIKLIPAALALVMLVGCSSETPKLAVGDKTVATATGLELDSYQSIFDKLYANHGVDVASKELLFQVAKYVLNNSDNWTQAQIDAEIAKRVSDKFDEQYTSTNLVNGLFDESKLVLSLQAAGHNIVATKTGDVENAPFKETVTNLVGNDSLKSKLTYDYSDYIETLTKDIYLDLLDEEYIMTQRATASTTYYTNKKVRKVQYFTYSPANSSEATKYAQIFQDAVEASVAANESFETLVTKDGGLEDQWKKKELEDLAKDFAMINARAYGYNQPVTAVNSDVEYPLPTKFVTDIAAYEAKYANDSTYGFRDIYSGAKNYDTSEKSEVTDKLSSYSNSGKQSIYQGYYEKQLAIVTSSYFTEKTTSSDHSSVINSTVNTKLQDMNSMYKETNYLDVYDTDSAVFKADASYYICYVEKIDDSATADLKKEAAKALATVSSNVKNSIYFYLTQLTEDNKLTISNQEIYDYLNETYNYGKED